LDKKYAFVSDLHANLEALQAVKPKLEGMQVFVLGDIVGYGADPGPVLRWVMENSVVQVQGNHDYAVGNERYEWLNTSAAFAARWTKERLDARELNYLKELPVMKKLKLDDYRVLLVHGSPEDPLHEYVFPETHQSLFDYYLEKYECDIIAMGHTHFPFSFTTNKGVLFNPGSVGQPRDGDPRSSFAILELEGGAPVVQHIRTDYDITGASRKIYEAGLPKFFGDRLYQGH
jgi:putative phosphoesterase